MGGKNGDAPVGGFLDLLRGEEEGVLFPSVERRRHTRPPDRNREPRSTPRERNRGGSDSGFPTGGWWRGGGTARAWLSLLFRPLLLAAISFLPGARLAGWLPIIASRFAGGRVGGRGGGRACAAVLGTWPFRCRVGCHTRLLPSDYQVKIIPSSCCHRTCVCIPLSSQLFEAGLLLLSSPVYPFLISR